MEAKGLIIVLFKISQKERPQSSDVAPESSAYVTCCFAYVTLPCPILEPTALRTRA